MSAQHPQNQLQNKRLTIKFDKNGVKKIQVKCIVHIFQRKEYNVKLTHDC